jgi:hypothetical protein
MPFFRASILTLVLVLPTALAAPAMARPNNGGYAKSAEALMKEQVQACSVMKDMLDLAESEADARAGTKAAAPYAEEADEWWAAGVRAGCGWAS